MLSPDQIKKLEKLAKVGDVGIADELNVLEGKIEALEEIVPQLREAKDGEDGYTPVKGVDYFDGKDGYTPVKGVDYFDGVPGRDGRDGKDSTVPGPKGEKGDMGPQGVPGIDGKDGFVDEATVAYLEDEVKKAKLDREAYDRALGIVDQRTSFLINKISNLQTALDALTTRVDGIGEGGDTSTTWKLVIGNK